MEKPDNSMFDDNKIDEEEKEESKFSPGKLINNKEIAGLEKELYSNSEGVYQFGKSYVTKYGKGFNRSFHGILGPDGNYHEVLKYSKDLYIKTGETRDDEWAPPHRNMGPMLYNRNSESPIGELSSPDELEEMPGWKKYSVKESGQRSAASFEIVVSPDGKIYNKFI